MNVANFPLRPSFGSFSLSLSHVSNSSSSSMYVSRGVRVLSASVCSFFRGVTLTASPYSASEAIAITDALKAIHSIAYGMDNNKKWREVKRISFCFRCWIVRNYACIDGRLGLQLYMKYTRDIQSSANSEHSQKIALRPISIQCIYRYIHSTRTTTCNTLNTLNLCLERVLALAHAYTHSSHHLTLSRHRCRRRRRVRKRRKRYFEVK